MLLLSLGVFLVCNEDDNGNNDVTVMSTCMLLPHSYSFFDKKMRETKGTRSRPTPIWKHGNRSYVWRLWTFICFDESYLERGATVGASSGRGY